MLTTTLERAVSEVIDENTEKRRHKLLKKINQKHVVAILDLAIYILDLITNSVNTINSLDVFFEKDLRMLFTIAYTNKCENALHKILSNTVLFKKIKDDLLAAMIKNFYCNTSQTSNSDEDYLRNFIQKYSLKVTIKHIELAVKSSQYWKLVLEVLDETELRSPANHMIFFKLVEYLVEYCSFVSYEPNKRTSCTLQLK